MAEVPGHTDLQRELAELTEAHRQLSSDYAALRVQNEAARYRYTQVVARQEAEKTQLRADLAHTSEQLNRFTTSTSWRLTRPLREAAGRQPVVVAAARSLLRGYPKARRAGGRVKRAARKVISNRPRNTVVSTETSMLVNLVREVVPPGARVLVAAQGDQRLLQQFGSRAQHFPQADSGGYAGRELPDSTAAIAHLEALRIAVAEYLVVPGDTPEWFHHNGAFYRYLAQKHRPLVDEPQCGGVFSLDQRSHREVTPESFVAGILAQLDARRDDRLAVLDWHTGLDLARTLPELPVFVPHSANAALPYIDRSVDVVVVRNPEWIASGEAHRVAGTAVICLTDPPAVDWITSNPLTQLPSICVIVAVAPGENLSPAYCATLRDVLPQGIDGEVVFTGPNLSEQARRALRDLTTEDPRVRTSDETVEVAARTSQAEVLVFVGERVVPLGDCVPLLLRSLQRLPQAGLVGCRVVGWNGRLREAGGVTDDDGNLRTLGAGSPTPDDPAHMFVREVDWCSRSFFATWRAAFERLDGFDPRYRSSRLQDADYCLRLRTQGRRTYYQPESTVVYLGSDARPVSENTGECQLFADQWSRSGAAVEVA